MTNGRAISGCVPASRPGDTGYPSRTDEAATPLPVERKRGGASPVSLRQVVTCPTWELAPHPREQRDKGGAVRKI